MCNNFTIVAIDTRYHNLTKKAVEHTIQITNSHNVLIFSDIDILAGSKWIKIDPFDMIMYNNFMVKEISQYIKTDQRASENQRKCYYRK